MEKEHVAVTKDTYLKLLESFLRLQELTELINKDTAAKMQLGRLISENDFLKVDFALAAEVALNEQVKEGCALIIKAQEVRTMSKIYITGDKHGDFSSVKKFCADNNTTKEDILIILGDVGLNYRDSTDEFFKKRALQKKLPITLFCLHGNHDRRPHNCKHSSSFSAYVKKEWCGGTVWYQESCPNILFPEDGSIFSLGAHKCLVIGGAYSTDKHFRLAAGGNYLWFDDEQPDEAIKAKTLEAAKSGAPDIVLSHTCPLELMPFYSSPAEDLTTEELLSEIRRAIPNYKRWYCGHHHKDYISGVDPRLEFLFDSFVEL